MRIIKLKDLLTEAVGGGMSLSASDIFNFYYLWYISTTSPQVVNTDYGREIMKTYLQGLKAKYVGLFKIILVKQIAKYIKQKRIDPDFPVDVISNLGNLSTSELKRLMAKTFRSDMKRRNDVWNMVSEFVYKLENSSSVNDMFLYINQLNNAVHNTGTQIMDKFPNFYNELKPAFDSVDKIKSGNQWELMKRLVTNKDIRGLLNQDVMETTNKKLCGSTQKVLH
jgi:hypothetical protein